MSLFNELKRRNVFRVGVAYLVGAWLLIQVSDIVIDNIGAPPIVLQVIFLALGVGFFVSLFVAWAFELTPEGVKREKDVDRSQSITPQTGKKLNNTILLMMALAIAYLLFDKFSAPAKPGSDHFSQQTSGQTTDANEKSALTPVAEKGPDTFSQETTNQITQAGDKKTYPAPFPSLMNDLGASPYWREKGFPPNCRPLGEKGFECD